jgi:hypothetical protein
MSSGSGGKSGLTPGTFEFGPSQFDLQSILDALSGNQQTTTNRYDQLGLGGSTMESQDLSQQKLLSEAAKGQVQTSEVNNPAFNPALQPATTNQQGTVVGSGIGAALGGLGKLVGIG